MDRERLAWLRIAAMGVDAAVVAAVWAVVVQLRLHFHSWWPFDLAPGGEPVVGDFDIGPHMALLALVAPIWVLALHGRGAYHYLRRKTQGTLLAELILSGLTAAVVLVAVVFLLDAEWVSRLVVVAHGALAIPALFATRSVAQGWLRRLRRGRFDVYRVALLGAEGDATPFREALGRHPEWGIEVVGRVESVEALGELLVGEAIDEVYVTRVDGEPLAQAAKLCDELGVRLSLDANFLGLRTARAELVDFDGWSLLSFSTTPTDHALLAVKRVLDVVGALLGLLLLAPLLALIAVAIKLHDGGPVFFVQQRSGRFGRPFAMIKFRTMVVDAEAQRAALEALNEASGPVFKLSRDPRVTGVGHLLRRSSLDELPQLLHVLLGQMSLVGPRPPLTSEVAKYERWQLRRLSMRPGLTCIWQVSGRSDLDFERWMELDLQYIDNWSLWLDLRLLAQTVPAVLRGTGAR